MSAMDTLSWNFLHMRLCILEIIPRVLPCFSVMTIISLSDFLFVGILEVWPKLSVQCCREKVKAGCSSLRRQETAGGRKAGLKGYRLTFISLTIPLCFLVHGNVSKELYEVTTTCSWLCTTTPCHVFKL